jgi:hypothetical protein
MRSRYSFSWLFMMLMPMSAKSTDFCRVDREEPLRTPRTPRGSWGGPRSVERASVDFN